FHAVRTSAGDKKTSFSNSAALLYAMYPFAIVWAPVLYVEMSSIFFALLSILFAVKETSSKNIFLAGFFGGLAALLRLQFIFCLAIIGAMTFFAAGIKWKQKIRHSVIFTVAIAITYGLWPFRNIVFQHRVLFSQDLNVGLHWS